MLVRFIRHRFLSSFQSSIISNEMNLPASPVHSITLYRINRSERENLHSVVYEYYDARFPSITLRIYRAFRIELSLVYICAIKTRAQSAKSYYEGRKEHRWRKVNCDSPGKSNLFNWIAILIFSHRRPTFARLL